MYCDNLNVCFIKHLESKGIKQIDDFGDEIKYSNITFSMMKEQIYIINEFHGKTLGYTGRMNKRLNNNIGRTIEQYKVFIKRLSKDLEKINEKGATSEFEKALQQNGSLYLARAQACIDTIYKNNYMSLIMRSMKRMEMCLGNTYFNNLRKNETIEIRSIEDCCYNMVEMDLAYLLSKIKRKGINMDFNNLIKEFCIIEALEKDSAIFIESIISYPYEFIKCCNRYRDKSKSWTEEEYCSKLEKSMILDGESLI